MGIRKWKLEYCALIFESIERFLETSLSSLSEILSYWKFCKFPLGYIFFFFWKSLYSEFTCIRRDQFNCCALSFLLAAGKYSIYVYISTRYEEKVVWNFVPWKFRIKIGIFRLGYFIRFYYVKSQCLMQLEIQDRTFKPDEEVTETAVTKVLDFKEKK